MADFFRLLFSGDGFIPRAICGRWTPGLIRLHNISDFLIWTAYLAIPIVLVYFAYSKRHSLPFRQLFWLFGLFILACGTTHLMDIVLFYNPLYRLSGLIKLVTAVASWGTVIALFHVVPVALQMRSPDELEREIQERRQVEATLQAEIEQHRRTEAALQQEVAKRQHLEAEWERIFDLSPDNLCVIGFDGFFQRLNPAWESSLGYSREELQAHSMLEFVHPDDVEKTVEQTRKNLRGENAESFENRFRCKDGTYKWLAWRTNAVPDEEVIYATARDTTQRKKTEQALSATLVQLERSNRELQDFASITSHDLQEPLRAIQAFGDRLQTRHSGSLDEQGRDYLNRMHNAAGRMRSLIQDLLTYSRVATQVQPFRAVDLGETIHAVLGDLSIRIEETGGRVEVGEIPSIEADPLQMRQLMQNLISNALKFHRDEEAPLVKITSQTFTPDENESESEEWLRLLVEDNGIGFESKFADRIFAPFERLHNKSKYSGTGIGLAICRKIIERHGGMITVESTPGEGSRFFIDLPICQAKEQIEEAVEDALADTS
jgi:PAS domain S-box-containing protein